MRPARSSSLRWNDKVGAATSRRRAISLAGSPSGAWRTNRRKTASLVSCASADRASRACFNPMFGEYWN